MKKSFDNVSQLQKWLSTAVGVTVAAVGIQSDLETVFTNITAPPVLASALACSNVEKTTPCFVEVEPSENSASFPPLDYEQYVAAFTIQVCMNHSGRLYGGHGILLSELKEYEYLVVENQQHRGFTSGVVLIRMPQSPPELEKLKGILLKKCWMMVVPDGSHQIHLGNIAFGQGFTPN